MNALITLTTDFGTASPYVAAMKGVLLRINPAVHIVDLTHEIEPQDVLAAAWFLGAALPFWPENALHVVVVDPGVGTERAILYVQAEGRRMLVPNNGVWTWLTDEDPTQVVEITDRRYWREEVSSTFHGRDIFAPVAAHLSLGVDPAKMGLPRQDWVRLARPALRSDPQEVIGEVVYIDRFGNLITNVPGVLATTLFPGDLRLCDLHIPKWVRTYGDANPGEVVGLLSSNGMVEIAVVRGNAAVRLSAKRGDRVILRRKQEEVSHP